MVSRLPRVLTATAVLFALSAVVVAQPSAGSSEPKSAGDLRSQQEQNAKQFAEFKTALLRLAQKLQRSEKPEDQERAKVILAALDLAAKENVDNQFQKLLGGMSRGAGNINEVNGLLRDDAQLTKTLQDILTILMTDDETARIKAEIAKLEAFLKEAKDIKRRQEILRALNEAQKLAAEKLSKNQGDLAQQTKDLANRMGGKKNDGDGKPGGDEPPPSKADPKSDAKEGDSAAEGKSDTQEPKSDSKDGKEGGGKEPSPADSGAESKSGSGDMKESGSPKGGPDAASEGKDNPAGEPRGAGEKPEKPDANPSKGDGDPKPGDQGEPKKGEPKAGEPKDGEGQPSGSKGSPKADNKSQGAGKAEAKGSKGEKGGDGKGKESPKSGEQQAGGSKGGGSKPPQQGGQPSPGGQSPPPPGGPQPPQQAQTPGRKQIQEAYPHQQDATYKLKNDKRPEAGKGQDKAIEELAKAIQELEKRLKQLREEEMLKLLANLEARCKRMLAMQIEVYEATKSIDATVAKNGGRKDTPEIQKAQQQGDKEGEIVAEADRSMKLLESEGSAVAFAKVLEEVRQDMVSVQRRLGSAYVDKDTQSIEKNIIDMLTEMVQALKKAQQEIQQQQQQPPPSGQPKPGNQKLIDLLAELKLIRSMQMQVNNRTRMYGDKEKAEQAKDPILREEIRQLSARQAKLQDMINKIATGANQ